MHSGQSYGWTAVDACFTGNLRAAGELGDSVGKEEVGVGEILGATVPIFLIVALGYACTRGGLLTREAIGALTTYVIALALPALIFVDVSRAEVSEILHPTFLLVYAIGALAMMGVGVLWSAARGRSAARRATISLSMGGTNNGIVGLPILLALVPEVAGFAVSMDMLVDSLVILPTALALFGAAGGAPESWGRRIWHIIARMFRQPLFLAILAAVVVSASGITLPGVVVRPLEMLANSASAVALVAVGGMLVSLNLRVELTDLITTVGAKLFLMPLVAMGLVLALPMLGLPALSDELRIAAVVTAALPSMSATGAFAEKYGEGTFGSAAAMLSTLLSFLTITLWLGVLWLVGWY